VLPSARTWSAGTIAKPANIETTYTNSFALTANRLEGYTK
jgi:hypothetical protein